MTISPENELALREVVKAARLLLRDHERLLGGFSYVRDDLEQALANLDRLNP